MSPALVAAPVSVLCISSVLGASSPPNEAFLVTVPSWPSESLLQYCDIPIPRSFSSEVAGELNVCHAQIAAIQKQSVKSKLLTDGTPNLFFCRKLGKKFVMIIRTEGQWKRSHLSELPSELIGKKARFFGPYKA
jgi:hypothetical protein